MRKYIIALVNIFCLILIPSLSVYGKGYNDNLAFLKSMPYYQVVKELALSRCLAQASDDNSTIRKDAAMSANIMREWMPFDMNSGDEKINNLISLYLPIKRHVQSDLLQDVKFKTLNCLMLYHSDELDKLSRTLVVGDPNHTWYQDNP